MTFVTKPTSIGTAAVPWIARTLPAHIMTLPPIALPTLGMPMIEPPPAWFAAQCLPRNAPATSTRWLPTAVAAAAPRDQTSGPMRPAIDAMQMAPAQTFNVGPERATFIHADWQGIAATKDPALIGKAGEAFLGAVKSAIIDALKARRSHAPLLAWLENVIAPLVIYHVLPAFNGIATSKAWLVTDGKNHLKSLTEGTVATLLRSKEYRLLIGWCARGPGHVAETVGWETLIARLEAQPADDAQETADPLADLIPTDTTGWQRALVDGAPLTPTLLEAARAALATQRAFVHGMSTDVRRAQDDDIPVIARALKPAALSFFDRAIACAENPPDGPMLTQFLALAIFGNTSIWAAVGERLDATTRSGEAMPSVIAQQMDRYRDMLLRERHRLLQGEWGILRACARPVPGGVWQPAESAPTRRAPETATTTAGEDGPAIRTVWERLVQPVAARTDAQARILRGIIADMKRQTITPIAVAGFERLVSLPDDDEAWATVRSAVRASYTDLPAARGVVTLLGIAGTTERQRRAALALMREYNMRNRIPPGVSAVRAKDDAIQIVGRGIDGPYESIVQPSGDITEHVKRRVTSTDERTAAVARAERYAEALQKTVSPDTTVTIVVQPEGSKDIRPITVTVKR